MRHVVLEIEEGQATLTLAEVQQRSLRILSCRRTPLPDLERGTVLTALRVLLSEVGSAVDRLHVVLGERRMQHFVTEVPKLGPDEIRDLIERESRRIGSLPGEVELLGHCWPSRRPRGRPPRVAAICIPRGAWQPIENAIAELGISVVSLTSMEHAIAGVVPASMPARTAVLEISAGRARFVLCEHDTVVHSRRFMLPPGIDRDGDSSMIQVHLAMEVPRTLEYLAAQGFGQPDALIVSHRVFQHDEDTRMLAQEVAQCVRYVPDATLAEGTEPPGLATFGILSRVTSKRRSTLHVLTPNISVEVPRSPARIVAGVVALAIGAAGGAGGFLELDSRAELHAAQRLARTELQQIRSDLTNARSLAEQEIPLTPDQARLLGILNNRRPLSLLVSRLANATVGGVVLESIEFGRGDRITVAGHVDGHDRVDALGRFSDYVDALEAIELISSDGREVIRRSDDDPNRVAFTINLAWRTP